MPRTIAVIEADIKILIGKIKGISAQGDACLGDCNVHINNGDLVAANAAAGASQALLDYFNVLLEKLKHLNAELHAVKEAAQIGDGITPSKSKPAKGERLFSISNTVPQLEKMSALWKSELHLLKDSCKRS